MKSFFSVRKTNKKEKEERHREKTDFWGIFKIILFLRQIITFSERLMSISSVRTFGVSAKIPSDYKDL